MDVSLLPEACTGALCSYCLEHKEGLLKCGRCKRAWYCNKDHQVQDYPKHKSTCRAVAPFVDALIDSIQDADPAPATYQEMRNRISAATHVAMQHAGMQRNHVFSCMNNTVFCRVCLKLREQLPAGSRLVCCPKCLWGWCCEGPCWDQQRPQHEQHCAEFAAMRRLNVLVRKQAQATIAGGMPLRFPMGSLQQQEQQQELLEGWQQYKRLRVPYVADEDTWRCMTDSLSVPLTALLAASKLYSAEELSAVQEFTLHLVGAAEYEFQHVMGSTAMEELMHLLPGVRRLHVVLVGPEWRRIAQGPTYTSHDKGTCPPCTQAGCKRVYSIYRGVYEEFAASPHWTTPTLALAANSGVGCEEQDSWRKAVKVLLDKAIPCCFTSMNSQEEQFDAEALQEAGADILIQGRNPFSSLVPNYDVQVGPDTFYYMNSYYICFKGRAAGAASSSS